MKTSVFVGASLDGFIARPNGAFDFLSASGAERDNGYDEFFSTVNALLIGRKTYEIVLSLPAWPYGPKPVFVLSSRTVSPGPAGSSVERISGDPPEILSQLSARGFHHVYIDGGMTIQSFLRAGLVQRLIITRVPVLIGTGIPLFGPVDEDIHLTHLATRQLSGGAVQSEYFVETARSRDMGDPSPAATILKHP